MYRGRVLLCFVFQEVTLAVIRGEGVSEHCVKGSVRRRHTEKLTAEENW